MHIAFACIMILSCGAVYADDQAPDTQQPQTEAAAPAADGPAQAQAPSQISEPAPSVSTQNEAGSEAEPAQEEAVITPAQEEAVVTPAPEDDEATPVFTAPELQDEVAFPVGASAAAAAGMAAVTLAGAFGLRRLLSGSALVAAAE